MNIDTISHNKFEVKKNSYGMNALFSNQSFQTGEIIAVISGVYYINANQYSIQTGNNEHIEPLNNLRYINHLCNPNTKIEGKSIIAIKPIHTGEEITFNYNHSEDIVSHPFICNCCGNEIKGKKYSIKKALRNS